MSGGLNDLEFSAFDAPLSLDWDKPGPQTNEQTRTVALVSVAISLKRIADAFERAEQRQ
jgi:hypothetical protein